MKDFSELKKSGLVPLSELPSPLATVYLGRSAGTASSHGPVAARISWLKREARSVARDMPPAETRFFREQISRIERSLREQTSWENGLLIFAGPEVWEVFSLPPGVKNELHWGPPALDQMSALLNGHRLYGALVLDRTGARFFCCGQGELVPLADWSFQTNVSTWKKKDLGHVSQPGIRKTRGSQRDTFDHRMDAQYQRFYRELAHHAEDLCRIEHLAGVLLVGSERMTRPIEKLCSPWLRARISHLDQDVAHFPLPSLQRRLEKAIAAWKKESEGRPASGSSRRVSASLAARK
jgi:hypothetical protein